MSHSTNSNVNFCDVCDLSFETKKDLYRHQSYDSKHKELLEKIFDSDDEALIDVKPKAERFIPPSSQPIPENMERVYDTEEYYFLRPKPKKALPLAPKLRVSQKLRVSLKLRLRLKLRVYLKITPKKLLKLNPSRKIKLKLMIVSTAELSLNVKNAMQNFEIK